MSPDIADRATPHNVTDWTVDKLSRHLADTCTCPWGDPCIGAELLGPLTARFVRDFNRGDGLDD
jgi:hypothetical protein